MIRPLVFAIPGDLDQATGGYGYDRRMIAELGALGWDVRVLRLPDGFPEPSKAAMERARADLAALPDASLVLIDGLAYGVMDEIARDEHERLKLVALVHHPLALETGISAERTHGLRASERAALALARGIVVTSETTARMLRAEFGVEPGRIAIAPPGTEPGPVSLGAGDPPLIVCVGSLLPRKGQDVLVAALARLAHLPWRCRIVGSVQRAPSFAASVRRAIENAGLFRRIELVGEVEDARAEMAAADIFALPTRFEGYGMVFAEAMSQRLPIVGCAVGAVPEVVPRQAGFLVPPNDPAAFARALGALVSEPAARHAMADAALEAAGRLPNWGGSAGILSGVLTEASR